MAEAVRNGRRAEFAKFPEFRDPERREQIPDPTARETFMSAKLGWTEAEHGPHAEWLSFYRKLLSLRHAEIIPRLRGIQGNSGQYQVLGDGAVLVQWTLGDGSLLTLATNLSAKPLDVAHRTGVREIFSNGSVEDGRLGAWSVVWSLHGG